MNVEFKSSFIRDLKRIQDRNLKARVEEVIERVERARHLREVENIQKLRGSDRYYRIKVGDCRVGLVLSGDIIVFVRFLHRKDIYRYFP